MTSKVFFSYSRQNSEFALRLGRDLRASGARIWLDQLDIQPGERWDVAIQKALGECGRILVILSPDAVGSTNVMDEVSYALEEKKVVIPVLHRDCNIPFRLRRLQHTDFRTDYAVALEKLVTHLAGEQNAPIPADPVLQPAIATTTSTAPQSDIAPRLPPEVHHKAAQDVGTNPKPPQGRAEKTVGSQPSAHGVRRDTSGYRRKASGIAAIAVALVLGIWAVTRIGSETAATLRDNGGTGALQPAVEQQVPEQPRADLPADKWGLTVPTYVITAAAFKTEREARTLRDKLQTDGYNASYLWVPDYASLSGNELFLTFVGPFADIEDCRRQLVEFRKTNPSAYGILVSNEAKRVEFTR